MVQILRDAAGDMISLRAGRLESMHTGLTGLAVLTYLLKGGPKRTFAGIPVPRPGRVFMSICWIPCFLPANAARLWTFCANCASL